MSFLSAEKEKFVLRRNSGRTRPFLAGCFLFACVLFLGTGKGWAQDITFHAEVDRTNSSIGSPVRLTLTVEGTQDVAEIPMPAIDGFDAQYLGPSTRISVVNGRYSASKSFAYSLLPLRAGRLTIPPVRAEIFGKIYATQPIEVDIADAAGAGGASSRTGTVTLEDKISLVLKAPRNEVYLHERLPVKIMLFVTDLSISDVRYPELKQAGIEVEPFGRPHQYEQIIRGVRYHIVEFDTNIYPTRTGSLFLEPAALECNIVAKTSAREPPFGRGSILDDDFFGAFFDRYEKRPMTIRSEGVSLNVLPLPEEGRPRDFSGAVGRFDFEASAAPGEVNAGDPVTLKMKISGEGSLKAVQFPVLKNAGSFKTYDPQVKEEGTAKTLEQVIIPQSHEITQVPVIEFSYFDPRLKKYQTISRGPFPLTVKKVQEEGLQMVSPEGQARLLAPEVLGRDIVFIKDSPGRFEVMGSRFYHSAFFYVMMALFCALWAALCVMYQRTHKIETDIVYARRLRAPREARKGLKEAARLKNLKHREEFYDALFKTLRQYLGNKLHLSAGTVTFEVVQPRLADQLNPEELARIQEAFEECDAIRYAPASVTEETMRESYARIERIIDHLERHLK